MKTDEELYDAYLNGREKAADELVERYMHALTLYLNSYTHDIHEAEDLTIEALAQMFAKSVRNLVCFKAYLFKTARNLASKTKAKHRFTLLRIDDLEFELTDEVLVEKELFETERREQLYRALGQLKTEYREVLYLVYMEDMSYDDAAKVLGRSVSAVTNQIYRGKQKLRVLLEQDHFEYAEG